MNIYGQEVSCVIGCAHSSFDRWDDGVEAGFHHLCVPGQVRLSIDDHLPVGSNESEVEAFLDSLKLDRVTITNFGYRDGE